MTSVQDTQELAGLPDDDEPKSFRELAEAAIMDLRRYAGDETAARRLVSAEAYEARFELLAAAPPPATSSAMEALTKPLVYTISVGSDGGYLEVVSLADYEAAVDALQAGTGVAVKAAQITMGRGLVDVTRIEHQGRSGILFRPRAQHIPVGDEGELPAGEYWPIAGDVVIWIETPAGASVILKYLSPFLAPVQQAGVDLDGMLDREAQRSYALQSDNEQLSLEVSQLQQRIAELKFALKTAETEAGYLAGKVARTEAASDAKLAEAVTELKALDLAYVNLLESGRDRIIMLGGSCDPVDVMEQADPFLRRARSFTSSIQDRRND